MKRLASISLLSLYLLFSGGLVISLHYCSGSLADAELYSKASCCCDDEGEAEDCCSDEIKAVKITDEQLRTEEGGIQFQHHFIESPSISFHTFFYRSFPSTIQQVPATLPRPPDSSSHPPVYLLHRSLLLYA